MKITDSSSADEAILEWLKAELSSARFGGELKTAINQTGYTENIITAANLANDSENKARLAILRQYRDWLSIEFGDYSWQWVQLNQDDVKHLHYIDYSYWNELSNNTRSVGRATENIAAGKIVFQVPNDLFHSVAKDIETGKELPPIILISNANNEPAEIIEGHLRATGYALAKRTTYPLRAILGIRVENNGST